MRGHNFGFYARLAYYFGTVTLVLAIALSVATAKVSGAGQDCFNGNGSNPHNLPPCSSSSSSSSSEESSSSSSEESSSSSSEESSSSSSEESSSSSSEESSSSSSEESSSSSSEESSSSSSEESSSSSSEESSSSSSEESSSSSSEESSSSSSEESSSSSSEESSSSSSEESSSSSSEESSSSSSEESSSSSGTEASTPASNNNSGIIPVTGGQPVLLNCNPSLTTVNLLSPEARVHFENLCGYLAQVEGFVDQSFLLVLFGNSEVDLPDEHTFVSGISLTLIKNGSVVTDLPPGAEITLVFENLTEYPDANFAVLYFDNSQWVDVPFEIIDGNVTVAAQNPGIYLLVITPSTAYVPGGDALAWLKNTYRDLVIWFQNLPLIFRASS